MSRRAVPSWRWNRRTTGLYDSADAQLDRAELEVYIDAVRDIADHLSARPGPRAQRGGAEVVGLDLLRALRGGWCLFRGDQVLPRVYHRSRSSPRTGFR